MPVGDLGAFPTGSSPERNAVSAHDRVPVIIPSASWTLGDTGGVSSSRWSGTP